MGNTINDDKVKKGKYSDTSPPSEQQSPPSYSMNQPDLTAAFSNLTLNLASPVPTTDQCIAHLKLLEAFHQLREDVAMTDGLFGIKDSMVPSSGLESERNDILRKIREKRWAVYVAKAVARFERWWQTSVEYGAVMIRQTERDEKFPSVVAEVEKGGWSLTKEQLPPLGTSYPFLLLMQVLSYFRCHNGLAFVYVEPAMLFGGLLEV